MNSSFIAYAQLSFIQILGVFNDIVLNLVWDPLMLLPDLCIMR